MNRSSSTDQDRIDLSQLGFEIAISRANADADADENDGGLMDVSTTSRLLEDDLAAPLPTRKDLGYDDDDDEDDHGAVSSVHSALSALSVGKPVRNMRSSIRRSVCSSTRRSTCSSTSSSIYTALSIGKPIRSKRASLVRSMGSGNSNSKSLNPRRSSFRSAIAAAAAAEEDAMDKPTNTVPVPVTEGEEKHTRGPGQQSQDAYAMHKALIAMKYSRRQLHQDAEEEEEEQPCSSLPLHSKSSRSRCSVVSALSSSRSENGDEFSEDSSSRRPGLLSRQSYQNQNVRISPGRTTASKASLRAEMAAANAAVVHPKLLGQPEETPVEA